MFDAFPAQLHALRQNLELTNDVVEEALRMRSSIRNVDRYALKDVEIGGVTIPKGGLVVVWLSAANRDPAVFENPDEFLVTRSKQNRHIAFGQGMHMCLGAPLARMEAQLAIRAILESGAMVELVGPPEIGPNGNFDIVTKQMVRFRTLP